MRVWVACLGTVALAGCGSDLGEAVKVRATVQNYAVAVANHDARTVCTALLSPDLAAATARAAGKPCPAALRDALRGPPPAGRVTDVRIDGDTATARLGRETLSLVRTRAGWRLASLGKDGGATSRP